MAIKRTHYQIAGSLLGRLIDTHNFILTKILMFLNESPLVGHHGLRHPTYHHNN